MNKHIKNIIISITLMSLILILSACFSLTSREKEYYYDEDNFISAIGTVTHIKYNDERTAIYIGFSELNPKFDDVNFEIVGKNLPIVQENGIDEKIQLGDQVEFITAPKYFGDGYVMPIVSISVDGEELLSYEEGYANFLEWLY